MEVNNIANINVNLSLFVRVANIDVNIHNNINVFV